MNSNSRILVVDDEPGLLQLYCMLLRSKGYEVWEATTGQKAFEVAREKRPDLVLLDVMLPDVSGVEVCRNIKAEGSIKDVFVVLVSGGAISPSEMVAGFEAGADEYLVKPLDLNEFLARVTTIVRLQETTAALRASKDHYRELLEILPDALFQTTVDGRITGVNHQAVKMLGCVTEAPLLQRSIFDFICPEDHKRARDGIVTLLTAGILRNQEYVLVSLSGHRFTAEVSATLQNDAKGEIVGLVGVVRDITERKAVEAKLQESQRRQQAILDNISDPAWLRDEQGRFLDCNEAFARVYGQAREEIIGQTLFGLAPKGAEQRSREDQEVMAWRRPAVYEHHVVAADGSTRWFETVKSPVLDGQGRPIGTVGIAHDVTDRKRTEEDLRTTQRRIIEAQEAERWRVARELHDGVNQIIASAKMRLRKVVDSGTNSFSPASREILARCDRLLIQALEENRRIARNLRPVELDELGFTEATRNLCREVQSQTQLTIDCRISGLDRRLPPAVELGLFRIVQEALSNVQKHAKAETVSVAITLVDRFLVLKIQDDGRGFGPPISTSARSRRRGLGLTNMRERAMALGGTCEVRSGAKQGTTITVRLPARGGTG